MQNTNRMGLGMRPAMSGYGHGQGPPISALSSHSYPPKQEAPPQPQGPKLVLFVGNISPGINDAFLTQLLSACGPLRSFKRTPTATGKPGAFGFAEFDEPDAVSRALTLLNGLTLPSMDEAVGPAKALKITADAKTKTLLEAYNAQKMQTDADTVASETSQTLVSSLIESLKSGNQLDDGSDKANDYVVPAHLKDLQEADLPESQRGIVLSEIALFRERAMKREKDKPERDRAPTRSAGVGGFANGTPPPAPSKERVWGKPKEQPSAPSQPAGWGNGPQNYNKPVSFVKAAEEPVPMEQSRDSTGPEKTDEEFERERQEARRRKEDISFRDRERRYEPRERQRIQGIERVMARERVVRESEERDRIALKQSLEEWDDDESDELFYTDRVKWRARRGHALAAENAQDKASKAFEEREAEHLRQESEAFLARQMADLQSLQEEQRKAGLLLVGEDAGPLRLNMSLGSLGSASLASMDASGSSAPATSSQTATSASATLKPVAKVFGDVDEEEEEHGRRRRKGLIKLDFGAAAGEEATKERLAKLKDSISKDKEVLFKFKVRWEALSDHLIDSKFEPLTKRKMKDYLGEMEDDDLIMFVVEHLKDHKGPQKLLEGLEPVLMEEAEEFVVALWRQVVFESVAYAEGLETEDIVLA